MIIKIEFGKSLYSYFERGGQLPMVDRPLIVAPFFLSIFVEMKSDVITKEVAI